MVSAVVISSRKYVFTRYTIGQCAIFMFFRFFGTLVCVRSAAAWAQKMRAINAHLMHLPPAAAEAGKVLFIGVH